MAPKWRNALGESAAAFGAGGGGDMGGKYKSTGFAAAIDGRIAPQNRPKWADTDHERQLAGVAQRDAEREHKFDPNSATENESLFQKAMFGRTMQKAAKNLKKEWDSEQMQQTDFRKEVVEKKKKKNRKNNGDEDESDSEPELEKKIQVLDPGANDLEVLRAQRLAEMKAKMSKQQEQRAKGHGSYTQITQDEFLPTVTASFRVVCVFFVGNIERCKIMDHHMKLLAKKHMDTKFICIDADKAPFFVERLAVRTVPSTVIFKDGVAINKILGFQGLGGDEFPTWQLARIVSHSDGIEEEVDTDEEYE